MYDGMAKKAAEGKRKAQRKLDLLQGYQSESDMKKYSPLLWEDNFGPNSPDYYSNQQLLKEKKNLREEKQRLKDLENGYYPSR
jgi:flagellar motility protein MotE (MotC chaperone)